MLTIFCPNNHLILDEPRCAQCGWARPPVGQAGLSAWGPINLGGGLGGPGRGMASQPAALKDILLLPLSEGQELGGIHLHNGKLLWRVDLQAGHKVRGVVSDGKRFLVSICDERPLEAVQSGFLAAISPATGQMTTLWEAGTAMVGQAIPLGDRLLLRTGASELILFEVNGSFRPIWRRKLQTWWSAAEPVVVGDSVLVSDGKAMLGEGLLSSYSLSDGQLLWQVPTEGLLPFAPRISGQTLLYKEGKANWVGRNLQDGTERWRQDVGRDYTSLELKPNTGESLAYGVVRGSRDSSAADHYQLVALDPSNGQPRWKSPLKARPRHLHIVDADTLLLLNDDGSLVAAAAQDGRPFWRYALGSEEDPLRTEPLVTAGMTFAGTRSGKIAAVWLKPDSGAPGDPEEHLRNGELLEAASGFALCGDFVRAAEIYENQIGEPEKAILLYEQGGDCKRAGELALRQELFEEALRCFENEGDLEAQARVLLEKGDELAAAERYEQSGDLQRAAELLENAGNPTRARDLYSKLGDQEAAWRVAQKMPADIGNIDWFAENGRLSVAAELAEKAGYLDRALQLYHQAEMPEREEAVLRRLVAEKPERWSLEKLAEMLKRQGLFEEEAGFRTRLSELPTQGDNLARQQLIRAAADAWFRAACQAEDNAKDRLQTANLFEGAMQNYQKAYEDERQAECWQKVIYYRGIPQIVVEGQAGQVFEEGGINHITLTVLNRGHGVARDIRFSVNAERFALDAEAATVLFGHISAGHSKPLNLVLQPKIGQYGNVPLVLYWEWKDLDGRSYNGRQTTYVRVKGKGESTGSDRPAQITVNGTYIQAEGGVVEMVGGDKVMGDQVEGDKVAGDQFTGDKVEAGGQKGDKVVVSRGGQTQVETDNIRSRFRRAPTGTLTPQQPEEPRCPNCKLIIDPGAKHCWGCGADLTGAA